MPVMHLTSYVPETLGSTFSKAELDRIPMFQLLTRAGAHISAGEQIVSATLADPVVAQRLEVKVGAALIDLRTMMVDQKGRAVEYVEMLAPPERLSLRFELGAEQFVSVSPKPEKEIVMSQAAKFKAMLKSGKMIVAPGAIDCITGQADRPGGLRGRLHDRRRHLGDARLSRLRPDHHDRDGGQRRPHRQLDRASR